MKRHILTVLSIVSLAFAAVVTPVLAPTSVYADPATEIRNGVCTVGDCTSNSDLAASVKNIVNVILFVLGMVAVIMIIIGGFRYVVSNGDSSAISSAKNTIFYAVIGLVIAIMAFAIVNFVLKSVK